MKRRSNPRDTEMDLDWVHRLTDSQRQMVRSILVNDVITYAKKYDMSNDKGSDVEDWAIVKEVRRRHSRTKFAEKHTFTHK